MVKKNFVTMMIFILAAVICAAEMFGADAPVPAQKQVPMDALTAIHSRKSVREYTGEPATKDEIETLLKAGMAAPTAVDKRPWAFVVVTDAATLGRLADGMPYARMIVPAKTAIVVCGVLSKALAGKARDFWVQDCSAATENILIAAEAIGLGAVWTGVYPLDENVHYVQKTLSIPADVIPLCVIAAGHPVGIEQPKKKFDPANIHWEKW
ncbi:MAG: nitroreductase family protein [Candidatus Omnitrophota bacterium]